MKFTELTIYTNTMGSEIVGGIITSAGISCYSVEDPADLEALLNDNTVPYDYIEEGLLQKTDGETLVKVYISQDEQGSAQLSRIKRGIEAIEGDCFGRLFVEENTVDDGDWADGWRQYFHPLPIGEKFIVKPTWEQCEPEGRIVLEIDPASSFGTGQHETTALCLRALEELDVEGARVLDMGCGSGILGIAAAKCGAADTVLVDIDSVAATIAEENLGVNKVESCKVYCGNVITDKALADKVFEGEYDIILANIVADVIKGMADMFYGSLKKGGTLVCSGVIGGRKEEVENILTDLGFKHIGTDEENDWVAIKCTK